MNRVVTTFVVLPRLLQRQTCAVSMRFAAMSTAKKTAAADSLTEPVKFSQSKAASWKSLDTFKKPHGDRLKIEPFVVSFSISVLLIYFAFLREENDLDLEMDKTLYERIPALEKTQLQMQIQQNKKQGIESAALQKRLQEVEAVIKKRKSLSPNQ
ncbi:Hypothetical predicted protein [Octopus vulgaris]|uniref:Uncharacterized protein n=2 Tax=Octopus TaxID=6643 RepID=A0AA36BWK4_OCTVU|nr:uncharacterized protein LOC115224194 [Octopus sinensis]CAI9740967.1 Hypothetical predicted protein [Octopus vulgaris]